MVRDKKVAVLISGPMRAGKTLTASYLSDKYGFRRYALADKLKQLHTAMTGSFEKDREWLQEMGSSIRSVFGEDFWAEVLIKQILEEEHQALVVDDIRYENELTLLTHELEDNGYEVIHLFVRASMDSQIIRGAEPHRLQHHSEHFATLLQNSIEDSGSLLFVGDEIDAYFVVLDGDLQTAEFLKSVTIVAESL